MIADPQRDTMFNNAVYRRGGMTLQALREKIDDDDEVLPDPDDVDDAPTATATARRAEFIALSERISGLDLDDVLQGLALHPGKPTTW